MSGRASVLSGLAVLLLAGQMVQGLSILVPASGEECFFADATRGMKVFASYNVFSGGSLDVDIKISDPNGKVVYDNTKTSEDAVNFVALLDGRYSVCFSNTVSTVTPKMLNFDFSVGNSLGNKDLAKQEHFSPLENAVILLSRGLQGVKDEVRYYKIREKASRSTSESTKSRVHWWSFFETLLLVGMSIWKIVHISNLLNKRP